MVQPSGIVVAALGVPALVWPYRVSRLGERMDAIGSTRRASEVEPADWNVLLTRIVGAAFVLFGVGIAFAG